MKNRPANRPVRPAPLLEGLEPRTMLSASHISTASAFPASGGTQPIVDPNDYLTQSLSARQVGIILAQAASQALPGQVVTVVDREGILLGRVIVSGSTPSSGNNPSNQQDLIDKSTARARTAAFFESTQNAFSTRTARFIIQDNFPEGIPNTGGGPLYGVEFSDIPGTDVLTAAQISDAALPTTLGPQIGDISGDPGGIPLYIDGVPVGGVGVSGDGSDLAVRRDLSNILKDAPTTSGGRVRYYGQGNVTTEEKDADEAVALAGAQGFQPNPEILADKIIVAGLRFPYVAESARQVNDYSSLGDLVSAGAITVQTQPRNSHQNTMFPSITITAPHIRGRVLGQLKNLATANEATSSTDGFQQKFGVVSGVGSRGQRLTTDDVEQVIRDAVSTALQNRGGIRQPLGVPVRVHVSVVDLQGNQLADFRMADGTNFSNDVAVQKARTALYFSDNSHALTSRSVGFLSQGFFPPGINDGGPGPLFHLQNALSAVVGGTAPNFQGPLRNGITIFPGGAPLYKNGILVGAVGISGDGVDQDDLVAFGGTAGFRPSDKIKVDALGGSDVANFLIGKIQGLANFGINVDALSTLDPTDFGTATVADFTARLEKGFNGVRIPYQKFPRNPKINK